MGHVYKIRYVRWLDAKNRRVKANTPGAKKEKKKRWSKFYWGEYRDADGNLKRVNLDRADKKNAEKLLAEIEEQVDCEKAGIVDPYIKNVKRPLREHFEEWKKDLELDQITEKRREEMPRRVEKLFDLAKWKRLTDITPETVKRALKQVTVKQTSKQVSTQTRNHYLQHLKQFLRWCVPTRLKSNPIQGLKRENVSVDQRHYRRALSDAEKKLLLTTTANSLVNRFGLDGKSRELLYTLALYSGFRRAELRSLTRESFDLENSNVVLAAAYSKHRRTDVQPLPRWQSERMRAWFSAGGELWPDLTKHTSKMMCADLKAAGIPYVENTTDGKRFADFHSLRHTFVTAVCRTKATVKEMMTLTRHTSAELFLKVYAKATLEGKSDCVNQLLDPLEEKGGKEEKSALAGTLDCINQLADPLEDKGEPSEEKTENNEKEN